MKKITVVVVDDERAGRRLLADIIGLISPEFGVVEFCDGKEVIDFYTGNNAEVDLVVTDLRMPRASGIEVVKFFSENFPSTKTILMSANAERNEIEEVKKLGAIFMEKPIKGLKEFMSEIKKILEI